MIYQNMLCITGTTTIGINLITYLHQHRSILNLDLESTKRDPISLGVSYFYLKFLNVHKKLYLKHFDQFSGKYWLNKNLLITFHLVLLFGELILGWVETI